MGCENNQNIQLFDEIYPNWSLIATYATFILIMYHRNILIITLFKSFISTLPIPVHQSVMKTVG